MPSNPTTLPAGDAIDSLILSRRFAEGLALLRAEGNGDSGDPGWARIRHCLARLGRLREAADAGRHAAARTGDPMDHLRLARILLDLHDVEAALPSAIRALIDSPAERRGLLLGPLVECLLRAPESCGTVAGELAALGIDPTDTQPARLEAVRHPTLHVPLLLPPYRGTDFDHPAHMRLIEGLTTAQVSKPAPEDWAGMTGFGAALLISQRAFRAFSGKGGPLVRARTARFVADRFPALLHPSPKGAVQFVMGVPLTLGEAPWIYWFDQLISAFQPTLMFERTVVSPQRTPDWHFLRALLADDRCRLVFSHFRNAPKNLSGFFQVPAMAGKVRHIRPYEAPSPAISRPARFFDEPLSILFTSSRTSRPETFFYRGGVDAIAIFRRYREKGGKGRLILRTPLPFHLNHGWLAQALADPAVTVLDAPLPAAEFAALRASCHVGLLPAALVYRASLVETMAAGLIPIGYDVPGIAEFIEEGRTGILTHRSPAIHRLEDGTGAGRSLFAFDAVPLLTATGPSMDPDACDRLAAALLDLDRDRPRLAAMAAAASEAASRMSHGTDDQSLFNELVGNEAERTLQASRTAW